MKKLGVCLAAFLLVAVVIGTTGCGVGNAPVSVQNRSPIITSLTATPTTVMSGGSSTLQCIASDPDGDPFTYTWTWTGGSIADNGSTVTWTAPTGFIGTYTIMVTVSDDKGGTASRSVTVTATDGNSIPQISDLFAGLTTVVPGGNTGIQCIANDSDGDSLTYTWTSTGGSITGTGSIVGWTAPAVSGAYTISVTVSDGKGGTASRSVTVTATDTSNQNPVITSLTANPTTVMSGGSSTLQCIASDPDGDPLSYSWKASKGSCGEFGIPLEWNAGTGSTATWIASSTGGTYCIRVTVSDGQGGTATKHINIAANSNPTISSLLPNPTMVAPSGSVTFTCTASDPDGDTLSYMWDTCSGTTGCPSWMHEKCGSISSTGSSITWTAPSGSKTCTIEVTVSDGRGGTATKSTQIVVNSNPLITSLLPTKSTVHLMESITVTCTASDPDGDTLSYQWKACSGTLCGNPYKPCGSIVSTGKSITWTAPSSGTGMCTIEVTVSDGRGGTATSSIQINIVL